MKLINKLLMECKSTTTWPYMAVISTNQDGTADMLLCFADGYRKEVSRSKSHHHDKQAADNALDEILNHYQNDERTIIIFDDVMDVAYCDPS